MLGKRHAQHTSYIIAPCFTSYIFFCRSVQGHYTCGGFAASCGHEAGDALNYASWGIDYVCAVGGHAAAWSNQCCCVHAAVCMLLCACCCVHAAVCILLCACCCMLVHPRGTRRSRMTPAPTSPTTRCAKTTRVRWSGVCVCAPWLHHRRAFPPPSAGQHLAWAVRCFERAVHSITVSPDPSVTYTTHTFSPFPSRPCPP
jgi:hypothetical protein